MWDCTKEYLRYSVPYVEILWGAKTREVLGELQMRLRLFPARICVYSAIPFTHVIILYIDVAVASAHVNLLRFFTAFVWILYDDTVSLLMSQSGESLKVEIESNEAYIRLKVMKPLASDSRCYRICCSDCPKVRSGELLMLCLRRGTINKLLRNLPAWCIMCVPGDGVKYV